ncbi:MAG: hypothetical protein K2L02_05335 [Clostridia bacterium]|nr:hypothetical protein [Clostridia bacterium]
MGIFEWVMMGGTYAVTIALSIPIIVLERRKNKRVFPKIEREIFRTRTQLWITVFFAVLGSVVWLGGTAVTIYCSIMIEPAPKAAYAAIVILMAFLALLSVVMILFGYTNSTVVCEEGVWVFRIFLKPKFFKYDEINLIQDKSALGIMGGGYIFFGKEHRAIFTIMYLRDKGADKAYALIQKCKSLKAEDIFTL